LAWYEKSFGEDYMIVYKHRDMQGAAREVSGMLGKLALQQGAEVLDLCCGMGRHALTIAEHGFSVSGLDLSDVLLDQARAYDKAQTVRWINGDMRKLPFADRSFDAVVNFFTSFGYFSDDAENKRVLLEIERVLRDDGSFLIDFLNPHYIARHLVPSSERSEGAMTIREFRAIESGFVKKTILIADRKGERRYEECVRLYELADFQRLLFDTSLTIEAIYGDSTGVPYEPQSSKRMILVGKKRASMPVCRPTTDRNECDNVPNDFISVDQGPNCNDKTARGK
jgi:ubiquinone/menaquinone biosynthesis C-methylase UbiE